MDAVRGVDPTRPKPSNVWRFRACNSLLLLIAIDVIAFVMAAWLVINVPEAFESAANSANASFTPAARLAQDQST